jgi:ABC-type bacteriocin/lantibiotic exporter with double-glycine peptidase domain
MAKALPLLKQEREDTCAIACLRMVLAGRGKGVAESDLARRTQMVEGGVEIVELERLARAVGLSATAREATAQQIRDLLREGNDVIAYVNRAVFDLRNLGDLRPALRGQVGHAVVPVRVTARHVTFHDPHPLRSGTLRKTVRRFEAAQHLMGSACLVISN